MQISNTRGLGGGSDRLNRGQRQEHVRGQIAARVNGDEARDLLRTIEVGGANKTGYLRLDGSGGDGALRFSNRWNLWPWRSAKGAVTGAAIKALFQKAGFPTQHLESFLAVNANRQISHRQISGLIASARMDSLSQEQLEDMKSALDVRKQDLLQRSQDLTALKNSGAPADPPMKDQENDLQDQIARYRNDRSEWRSQCANFQARKVQERLVGDVKAAQAELKTSLDMYRTIQFRGQEVGGGARPAGTYLEAQKQTAEVCALLRIAGYNTILSIDASPETDVMHADVPSDLKFERVFKWTDRQKANLADELGRPVEPEDHEDGSAYVVEDFTAPTLEVLQGAVSLVAKACEDGNKVFIHCGGGAGRTGTVLAALMLLDRLESAREGDPNFDPLARGKSSEIDHLTIADDDTKMAYGFVADVVAELRLQDHSRQGYRSVETGDQVQVLNQFLEQLVADQAI